MKHNSKPFSVEIKKSRIQGQRTHLPPRRLFAAPPAEATKAFQKEEPQVVPEPSAAPRILPSIVEPVWSSEEPVETALRKRSSVTGRQKQMEFDLVATASEHVEDVPAGAQLSAQAVSQTDTVFGDSEGALRAHDIQPARTEGVKAKSRKHRRTSEAAEQETVSDPDLEAEMTAPSMASLKAAQRRLTKRLAAAAQLPRHERWKGRLHPAAW
jgi:hypothetical protein